LKIPWLFSPSLTGAIEPILRSFDQFWYFL